jgi:hypothetical protein
MISAETIKELESSKRKLPYILGARMRKVNSIKNDILCRGGRYREVYPEGITSKDPAPLKVKEICQSGKRYIVCLNTKQARKDAADRQAILDDLEQKIRKGPKGMIGNKGYRRYLKVSRGSNGIDCEKVKEEARFDGKWVLQTNTDMTAEDIALKYKELWQGGAGVSDNEVHTGDQAHFSSTRRNHKGPCVLQLSCPCYAQGTDETSRAVGA